MSHTPPACLAGRRRSPPCRRVRRPLSSGARQRRPPAMASGPVTSTGTSSHRASSARAGARSRPETGGTVTRDGLNVGFRPLPQTTRCWLRASSCCRPSWISSDASSTWWCAGSSRPADAREPSYRPRRRSKRLCADAVVDAERRIEARIAERVLALQEEHDPAASTTFRPSRTGFGGSWCRRRAAGDIPALLARGGVHARRTSSPATSGSRPTGRVHGVRAHRSPAGSPTTAQGLRLTRFTVFAAASERPLRWHVTSLAAATCSVLPPRTSVVYVRSLLSHRLSNEGGLNLPCLVE